MPMKFVALLPVRDESDIIDQCLDSLLTWADEIYIFDTGSLDDTWERVLSRAAAERRVVPIKKSAVFFSEKTVRGYLFEIARRKLRNGDWFARVDADEFHLLSPRSFIQERLSRGETIAYHQYYNFELLDSEAVPLLDENACNLERRKQIRLRRRHYTISHYSEPRLCMYRDTMCWPASVSFPYNAGYLARCRIPILHYPHRDPTQLARRCLLRAAMMGDSVNRLHWSKPELHHWSEADWTKFLRPCNAPGLLKWKEGEPFAEVHQLDHLRRPPIRLIQRFLHMGPHNLLDRFRHTWLAGTEPQPISLDTQQSLCEALSSSSISQCVSSLGARIATYSQTSKQSAGTE